MMQHTPLQGLVFLKTNKLMIITQNYKAVAQKLCSTPTLQVAKALKRPQLGNKSASTVCVWQSIVLYDKFTICIQYIITSG
jgi:hypothetical protein